MSRVLRFEVASGEAGDGVFFNFNTSVTFPSPLVNTRPLPCTLGWLCYQRLRSPRYLLCPFHENYFYLCALNLEEDHVLSEISESKSKNEFSVPETLVFDIPITFYFMLPHHPSPKYLISNSSLLQTSETPKTQFQTSDNSGEEGQKVQRWKGADVWNLRGRYRKS